MFSRPIKYFVAMSLIFVIPGCQNIDQYPFLADQIPGEIPIDFLEQLTPADKLIHRGVLNPEMDEYYFTLSDKSFGHFDIYVISREENTWSEPKKAFFNSADDDHGMSFSPDGQTIYFSSTRPTQVHGIPSTWHLWKSQKVDGQWTDPIFIDIPNLRDKLLSHPSISETGQLYFHASELDYSQMDIYTTIAKNGVFEPAEKVFDTSLIQRCTPFISAKEEYLLFGTIGDQLDLMIAFKDNNGDWRNPRKLDKAINTNGQGNPYVTTDNKFLFYATGKDDREAWQIKWMNFEKELRLSSQR